MAGDRGRKCRLTLGKLQVFAGGFPFLDTRYTLSSLSSFFNLIDRRWTIFEKKKKIRRRDNDIHVGKEEKEKKERGRREREQRREVVTRPTKLYFG